MTVEELNDEICAIDAIYPETTQEIGPQIYQFNIPQHPHLQVQISFPIEYPDEPPSILQVTTSKGKLYTDLNYIESTFISELQKAFHQGEVCLFDWFLQIESILEPYHEKERELEDLAKLAQEKLQISKQERHDRQISIDKYKIKGNGEESTIPKSTVDPLAGWSISEPIEDRGSVFIGFAREAHSVEEAQLYLSILLTDRKIARAAHNMTAWRIKGQNGVQWQDCDDDGETAAGGRMLHLLQVCILFYSILFYTYSIILTSDDECLERDCRCLP